MAGVPRIHGGDILEGMDNKPPPRVEIVGSGKHYVWNDNQTGLIAKDGPIDGSKPFFIVGEGLPNQGWPDGWVTVGYTVDDGTNASGE